MSIDVEMLIRTLQDTIAAMSEQLKSKDQTIAELNNTIRELQRTVANLTETLREVQRKMFGTSSEQTKCPDQTGSSPEEVRPETAAADPPTKVKEHTRTRKPKRTRDELYDALPVKEVLCNASGDERNCPDCGAVMNHLGYKFIREELRVIPARVFRVRYMQETLVCPACREEDDAMICGAPVPTPLIKHSPASASIVAYIMYEKLSLYLPFYRQEADWLQRGVPIPRERAAAWFNRCAVTYLKPIYDELHRELLKRDIIHADEVPCQVLHEPERTAEQRSYMWIYLSGTDGRPPVITYKYCQGRKGRFAKEFLEGYKGIVHCDGYSAYGMLEDVLLVCCSAHCRRKFFEAVPVERKKQIRLLDIHSDQEIHETEDPGERFPAERGVYYFNRLFALERRLKDLDPAERKRRRQKEALPIWEEFWQFIEKLEPAGGSKLEKAVMYSLNHKEEFMNYLQDGRCELSNNAAERRAKSYVLGRKNFLFHDTENGAEASAYVLSIIETAKANHLNVFQYLYTLLLYMPDYKDEPAGIVQLMPWSSFIRERCSGLSDTENITPENRGILPF